MCVFSFFIFYVSETTNEQVAFKQIQNLRTFVKIKLGPLTKKMVF